MQEFNSTTGTRLGVPCPSTGVWLLSWRLAHHTGGRRTCIPPEQPFLHALEQQRCTRLSSPVRGVSIVGIGGEQVARLQQAGVGVVVNEHSAPQAAPQPAQILHIVLAAVRAHS